MTYPIKLAGVTYHVEPFEDAGQLFAVIHSMEGLAQYGLDELPMLVSDQVHAELVKQLNIILKEEDEESMLP